MRLKCLGSAELPHEEVQWLGIVYPDAFCWYCTEEGIDMVNKMKASKVSVTFRHPPIG